MTPYALVVGEALVDVVRRLPGGFDGPDRSRAPEVAEVAELPGGSAANVAVALRRLGRPVRFATAFTDDHFGALLGAHLDGNGVEVLRNPGAVDHSSSAQATIALDGSATYDFDVQWSLGPVELDRSPVLVHVCSLAAVLPPGADDVLAVVEQWRGRALISYDVNTRPALTGTGPEVVARVELLAGLADLVKASDEDLEALWPALSLEDSIAHVAALCPALVVTRGASGSEVYVEGRVVRAAPVRVQVADTIGAGDTFGAATLDALWTHDLLSGAAVRSADDVTWQQVLDHAAKAAAVTVSRPGADPPYSAELV